jgi:hypothetical protein
MGVRVLTARRVAGGVAVVSVAVIVGGLALAYVDRHLPAGRTAWNLSAVFGGVADLVVPVVGFVLASRRPGNGVGWLLLAGACCWG